MTGFSKLFDDVGRLWSVYGEAYLRGVMNTLILAVVATIAGCVIGLVCGVLFVTPIKLKKPTVSQSVAIVILGIGIFIVHIALRFFYGM